MPRKGAVSDEDCHLETTIANDFGDEGILQTILFYLLDAGTAPIFERAVMANKISSY